MEEAKIRPSKKQYELLEFIGKFIDENGYGPSYREIMSGCNYSSVATVAVHVNNLIKKGHLNKNGRSARSLEVISSNTPAKATASSGDNVSKEKWLAKMVEAKFAEAEKNTGQSQINELETLVNALKILGFSTEANRFQARLEEIRQKHQ